VIREEVHVSMKPSSVLMEIFERGALDYLGFT